MESGMYMTETMTTWGGTKRGVRFKYIFINVDLRQPNMIHRGTMGTRSAHDGEFLKNDNLKSSVNF